MTRAAVARYLDALNGGDPDAIAACVTEDFYNEHTSALGHSRRGRAAYRERLPSFLAEFTGLHYDVEDTVVEGDRAAVAYTMTCVYHGDPVSVRGVFRFRVEDGLVAHRVDYWDSAAFTAQLSTAAPPGP
ncbi:MAG TPA: nuclear transport factor 2 family protein [Acidimicrobiales bacterium]|nr:nuclear transport factor 2 family protein [Acidimicrobiales bacterium]